MGVKKLKPTSPGRRFQTVSDFDSVTKSQPEKSLLDKQKRSSGRNSYGRITSRHRGGGHKQRYRVIDFRRTKDGVPAKVAGIEYDPNRNARIALLHYVDGEKRYILAPIGIKVGDMLESGAGAEIRPGNALRCATSPPAPWCTAWSSGPVAAPRWAVPPARPSSSCPRSPTWPCCACPRARCGRCSSTVVRRWARWATPTPSWSRSARPGAVAGRASAHKTRGVAMNPVDHPLGGGEGRSSGGRHPVSPWGKPEGRTRKKNKASDKFIVRRRAKKGRR